MRSRVAALACLIATTATLAAGTASAASYSIRLRFAVCGDNIAKSWVADTGEGDFTLAMQLDEPGRKQLLELSEQHMDERVDVVFDGIVLMEWTFQEPITTGYIAVGSWSSRGAADGMARLIRDRSLRVPCGPIPPGLSPASKD